MSTVQSHLSKNHRDSIPFSEFAPKRDAPQGGCLFKWNQTLPEAPLRLGNTLNLDGVFFMVLMGTSSISGDSNGKIIYRWRIFGKWEAIFDYWRTGGCFFGPLCWAVVLAAKSAMATTIPGIKCRKFWWLWGLPHSKGYSNVS